MPRAHVLIVDDEPTSREIVGIMLSGMQMTVAQAANGFEALERVSEQTPDVVLMDLLMPAMDGLEATRRLRAQPATAHVPILALTALAFPADREKAQEAGCDGFLLKPFTRRDLIAALEPFLPPLEEAAPTAAGA